MFEVGDKVVYPQHGAGIVVRRESRTVVGVEREYLTIQILHNEMTVMVPVDGVDDAGLRPIIGDAEVEEIIRVLRGDEALEQGSWSRRFKDNRERLRTGDVLEVAEVIKNLSIRAQEKGLSSGEKQMLSQAKRVLASELSFAKDLDEEAALVYLDEQIADAADRRQTAADGAVS